jgi:hypothetical protein
MRTYNANKHEDVVHAKSLSPYSHSHTHEESDPTQHKKDDRPIPKRHSITSYFDSAHICKFCCKEYFGSENSLKSDCRRKETVGEPPEFYTQVAA